ncbi:HlyU family transcriptional regulator [Lichenihabitans psoromatis]|uniref:HlyU family transcriptional regulator n=1 Tax=Lichenihabitans psoromatis TaxID=2528642 RepID=UPI00103833E5|nr:HlyU family transcriptional regulator [Lichenihabitans psoromatis]
MSFLKSLFGGGVPKATVAPAPDKTTGQIEHKGFVIRAVPFKSEGQYQTAGIIEKEVGGTMRSYRFVRADRSTMVEDVTELALSKGQKIIDEQGDALFN